MRPMGREMGPILVNGRLTPCASVEALPHAAPRTVPERGSHTRPVTLRQLQCLVQYLGHMPADVDDGSPAGEFFNLNRHRPPGSLGQGFSYRRRPGYATLGSQPGRGRRTVQNRNSIRVSIGGSYASTHPLQPFPRCPCLFFYAWRTLQTVSCFIISL